MHNTMYAIIQYNTIYLPILLTNTRITNFYRALHIHILKIKSCLENVSISDNFKASRLIFLIRLAKRQNRFC